MMEYNSSSMSSDEYTEHSFCVHRNFLCTIPLDTMLEPVMEFCMASRAMAVVVVSHSASRKRASSLASALAVLLYTYIYSVSLVYYIVNIHTFIDKHSRLI